jgi:hypothetical protein
MLANHLIDIDPKDPDRATGTVYCRCEAEIEFGKRWLIQQIVYHDKYVRLGGEVAHCRTAAPPVLRRRIRQPPLNLPPSDAAELTDGKGSMPQYWESYRAFWQNYPDKPHY